jgi:pyruvate formate lyase activating enzyme
MVIGGFQKFSLIDYPGKISCIIFLSGCNFRCPFCYSTELVLPNKIESQPVLDKEKIFSYLEERKGMLEGVVLCGGEPTLNAGLPGFCKSLKDMGYSVKLDTNGSNPGMLESLIEGGLIDYIAMDIKGPLEANTYRLATGTFDIVDAIKDSISIIKRSGIDYEFRSTIVPGIHSLEDIVRMAEAIAPADKYFLQQFVGDKETIDSGLMGNKPFPYDRIKEVVDRISPSFRVCHIR